jgi:hypothetical protein
MRDKPVGGKKKVRVTYTSADAREGKAKAKAAADFKQFGDYLRAKDVSGKGRSAAAGRRQAGVKKAATEITAKKLAGYAPAASSASGTKKTKSQSAAYQSRAGMRRPKPRIPNTK